jgi:drug/metabolite transporter (DMT)-like permease
MPGRALTGLAAALYVLSGVTQPLLMTLAKDAGLADPTCQLYMVFYQLGPASFIFVVLLDSESHWPSWRTCVRAASIGAIDIVAQAMNYTGGAMAGPTLFAIIYSSVTVWTAVLSRLLLRRKMGVAQWLAICVVFSGLSVTAFSSVALGPDVFGGCVLVLFGSALHSSTYVLSEWIMTTNEKLPVKMNLALQGSVACSAFIVWQLVYTLPRFKELIGDPMRDAETTVGRAVLIFTGIFLANLLHAVTFQITLKHFIGGATSAGVMKGLQAVLVFAATSFSETVYHRVAWLLCCRRRVAGILFCFLSEHTHRMGVQCSAGRAVAKRCASQKRSSVHWCGDMQC